MRADRKAFSGALVSLIFAACILTAQTNNPLKSASKVQQEYFAQFQRIKEAGRAAYSDEEAREKSGDCPKATTTLDMNMCFSREVEKTAANYKAYIAALRASEGLVDPSESGAADIRDQQHSDPLKRLKKFDAVEIAWKRYYQAQCPAAYESYAGGTIAPMMELTCKLQLMRDRMHELEGIYQFTH